MNIEIIYMLLPVAFLLQAVERGLTFAKWALRHGERSCFRVPITELVVSAMDTLTARQFLVIAAVELLLVLAAEVCFVGYSLLLPMLLVLSAMCMHGLARIVWALLCRTYVPGLVTAVLLMPYYAFCMLNVAFRWSATELAIIAFTGFCLFFIVTAVETMVVEYVNSRRG